jgi:hypothetical protein
MSRLTSLFTVFLVFASMIVFCASSPGQGFTASVLGTVKDVQGGVIGKAGVTVTNLKTGLVSSIMTDSSGNYTVPQLPPGDYRIEVETPGFKRSVRSPVTLQVDQRQAIDFTLSIGDVTENVVVSAQAPQLQAETATVGTTVTGTQTEELPLNGRNFVQLNLLVPGAAPQVKGSNLSAQGGSIEVHGLPENQNYFWLNGIDNTTDTIGQYTRLLNTGVPGHVAHLRCGVRQNTRRPDQSNQPFRW